MEDWRNSTLELSGWILVQWKSAMGTLVWGCPGFVLCFLQKQRRDLATEIVFCHDSLGDTKTPAPQRKCWNLPSIHNTVPILALMQWPSRQLSKVRDVLWAVFFFIHFPNTCIALACVPENSFCPLAQQTTRFFFATRKCNFGDVRKLMHWMCGLHGRVGHPWWCRVKIDPIHHTTAPLKLLCTLWRKWEWSNLATIFPLKISQGINCTVGQIWAVWKFPWSLFSCVVLFASQDKCRNHGILTKCKTCSLCTKKVFRISKWKQSVYSTKFIVLSKRGKQKKLRELKSSCILCHIPAIIIDISTKINSSYRHCCRVGGNRINTK